MKGFIRRYYHIPFYKQSLLLVQRIWGHHSLIVPRNPIFWKNRIDSWWYGKRSNERSEIIYAFRH
jgi:hypothetical protein